MGLASGGDRLAWEQSTRRCHRWRASSGADYMTGDIVVVDGGDAPDLAGSPSIPRPMEIGAPPDVLARCSLR